MSEQNTNEYDANLNKALEVAFEGVYQQGEVTNVSVSSIGGGAIQNVWRLGSKGQIILNDGDNDRIIIGYQKDGF